MGIQRIYNLAKWGFLREGEAIAFLNPRRRVVVLEVNAPGPVCLYVMQDPEDKRANPELVTDREAGRTKGDLERSPEAEAQFLAFVPGGRETLEFGVDGAFELISEGGSCYVYTADSQDVATRVVAPLIYTRIANRRQRNPHLEMIEYQMRLSQERFRAQLEMEVERRISAVERGLERHAPQRDIRAPAERVGRAESASTDRQQPSGETSGEVRQTAPESEAGGGHSGDRTEAAAAAKSGGKGGKAKGS